MEKEEKNFSGETISQGQVNIHEADLSKLIADESFQKEAARIVRDSNIINIEDESKILESKKDMHGEEGLSDKENKTLNINDVRKGKFKDFFSKAINIDISNVYDVSKRIEVEEKDVSRDSDDELDDYELLS